VPQSGKVCHVQLRNLRLWVAVQVHGSEANAASNKVTWSQLPGLVIEACKLPLLWYLATAGLSCECFAGDTAGDAHSLQDALATLISQVPQRRHACSSIPLCICAPA
jgi:hypothetical protein